MSLTASVWRLAASISVRSSVMMLRRWWDRRPFGMWVGETGGPLPAGLWRGKWTADRPYSGYKSAADGPCPAGGVTVRGWGPRTATLQDAKMMSFARAASKWETILTLTGNLE